MIGLSPILDLRPLGLEGSEKRWNKNRTRQDVRRPKRPWESLGRLTLTSEGSLSLIQQEVFKRMMGLCPLPPHSLRESRCDLLAAGYVWVPMVSLRGYASQLKCGCLTKNGHTTTSTERAGSFAVRARYTTAHSVNCSRITDQIVSCVRTAWRSLNAPIMITSHPG